MGTAHPFRFALMADEVTSRTALLETAREAEASGFSALLMRDHFTGPPYGSQFGPVAALATVAAATRDLRIGTLVACNDYRHPVLLAQEAATLDVLSEGRFELGLGAGFNAEEYAAAGLPFDPPGVRVGRLEEAVRIIKGLFAGEPYALDGRHYTIGGLSGFPVPARRPPIQVAGAGPRLLGIAAREADIAGLLGDDDPAGRAPGAIAAKTARILAAAPDPDALEISMFMTLAVTRDRDAAAERVAAANGWTGVGPAEVRAMPASFIGEVAELEELLHERRAAYGVTYYVVPRRDLAAAAPLVARMTGA
ncbi:MAG TPA: TIGR03621 family F420-dependent LLM class oxidoreductase [Streptosporangiaceae bacterium]|jgi:probable F420-dependent oxidoreductase